MNELAATRSDVKRWKAQGIKEGAEYLIVVCDTFDWSDYPVYVYSGENVNEKRSKYDGVNMQRIMEVIDLRKK